MERIKEGQILINSKYKHLICLVHSRTAKRATVSLEFDDESCSKTLPKNKTLKIYTDKTQGDYITPLGQYTLAPMYWAKNRKK